MSDDRADVPEAYRERVRRLIDENKAALDALADEIENE